MSESNADSQRWAAEDARGLGRRLVGGVGSQIVTLLIYFARTLLIVPFFITAHGVDGFADWAKLVATANILAAIALGQFVYYGYHIRTAYAARDTDNMNYWIACNNAFHFYIFVLTLSCLVGVLTVIDLRSILNLQYLGRVEAAAVLALLVFSMLGQSYRDTLRAVYTAHGEFTRSEIIRSIGIALITGGSIVALIMGLPVLAVAIIHALIVPGFVCATALVDFARRYPDVRFTMSWRIPAPSRARLDSLVAHAVPNFTDSVLQFGPTMLLGVFGVASELVVQFNLARTALGVLRARLVARIFAVEMTRQRVQEDWRGFRRLHWLGAIAVGVFAGGLFGALTAFWPFFLPLWTAGAIRPDMLLFLLLAIDSTVVNVSEHSGSLLRFGGQIGVVARYATLTAIFVAVFGISALAYADLYWMVAAFIVANAVFFHLLPPFALQRRIPQATVPVSLLVPPLAAAATAPLAYGAMEFCLWLWSRLA